MGGVLAIIYGEIGCCWASCIGVGIGFVTYGLAEAFNNSLAGDILFGIYIFVNFFNNLLLDL